MHRLMQFKTGHTLSDELSFQNITVHRALHFLERSISTRVNERSGQLAVTQVHSSSWWERGIQIVISIAAVKDHRKTKCGILQPFQIPILER